MRSHDAIPVAQDSGLGTAFTWPVRVYYEDTDAGGVVYYANYLKFLERARTEWLRAQGFGQEELAREHGVVFVVRRVEADYLKPARLDDELTVTLRVRELGRSRIEFSQTVEKKIALMQAVVQVVCVGAENFKPVQIPAPVRQKIEKVERIS
ncbi:MAG: tol-pal system-associated acyl-CoA thioesterase [Sulfuricella sp.]|nr:tol-pal system-associated acyl-CoA thioesterase [Sulfuricella sp.]